MGISSSSNRRRQNNNNNYYHQNSPSQLISSYPSTSPQPLPQPAPPPPQYHPYTNNNGAMIIRPNYVGPYNNNNNNQVSYNYGFVPPFPPPPQPQIVPPAYVDHQQAKKVKNHVNLHKDSLRVVVDEENGDCHLVEFVFDASFDGSITIYYFAKEEPECNFVPIHPEVFAPVKISFQKGTDQKFKQQSGTGIDLGFFDFDYLSKPSSGEHVYPLVICAETTVPLITSDQHHYGPLPNTVSTPHKQITQAVLEKNNGNPFKAKVMRQILWIDGVRYELREIYGIGKSEERFDDTDSGKECVICMTEPKDTAVLPCRHMCLCSECAKALRVQSNKCPICRQPIEELMEIKIDTTDQ